MLLAPGRTCRGNGVTPERSVVVFPVAFGVIGWIDGPDPKSVPKSVLFDRVRVIGLVAMVMVALVFGRPPQGAVLIGQTSRDANEELHETCR